MGEIQVISDDEKLSILEYSTNRFFIDKNLPFLAMKAAHRGREDGILYTNGHRPSARSGIEVVNQCIDELSVVKDKDNYPCRHTVSVYKQFHVRENLIQIANKCGVTYCIKHSIRQAEPMRKVISFAMWALIAAVYQDSDFELRPVMDLLDYWAQYLQSPPAPSTSSSDESDNLDTPMTDSPESMSGVLPHITSSGAADPAASFLPDDMQIDMNISDFLEEFSWEDLNRDSDIPQTNSNESQSFFPMYNPSSSSSGEQFRGQDFQDTGHSVNTEYVDPRYIFNSSPSEWLPGSSSQTIAIEHDYDSEEPQQTSGRPAEASQSQHEHRRAPRPTEMARIKSFVDQEILKVSTADASQMMLLDSFEQTFRKEPTDFRKPGDMWKLNLAPLNANTFLWIKAALNASYEQLPDATASSHGFDGGYAFSFNKINEIGETTTAAVIQKRYYVYQFYKQTVTFEEAEEDAGWINETRTFSDETPKREVGNRHNLVKANSIDRILDDLKPGCRGPERTTIRSQVRSLRKLGSRLSLLVEKVGSKGILCLLPFPAEVSTEHQCLSMELNRLSAMKIEDFESVLKSPAINSTRLRQFCQALEPILQVIRDGKRNQQITYRLETLSDTQILNMGHGSSDLLYQLQLL